jgi:hypothetical protein
MENPLRGAAVLFWGARRVEWVDLRHNSRLVEHITDFKGEVGDIAVKK